MSYFIYILSNERNGTLYIGMTSNLIRRVHQHKHELIKGFTKRYGIHTLVYYEVFKRPVEAIRREKQLKKWNRLWKMKLIESVNPSWKDLYENII